MKTLLVYTIANEKLGMRHVLVCEGIALDEHDELELIHAGWYITCQVSVYQANTADDVRKCVTGLLHQR